MSVRSTIDPANLHDEAFARDPFPVWERLRHDAPLYHDTVDDVYSREGLVRLFRDRRPSLVEPLPPLRMHLYHLTVPCLRVTLTEGGS